MRVQEAFVKQFQSYRRIYYKVFEQEVSDEKSWSLASLISEKALIEKSHWPKNQKESLTENAEGKGSFAKNQWSNDFVKTRNSCKKRVMSKESSNGKQFFKNCKIFFSLLFVNSCNGDRQTELLLAFIWFLFDVHGDHDLFTRCLRVFPRSEVSSLCFDKSQFHHSEVDFS